MESAVGVQIQTGPSMQGMQQAHGRKSEWRVVGEGAGVAGSSSGSSQQQGRVVDGGAGVGGGQSRATAARARSNPGGVGAGGPRNSNRSRNGRLFNPNSSTHSSDSENQERLSGVGESQAMSSVTQDAMSKPSGGRAEVYSEMRHHHNHVALHVAQLSAAPPLGGDDSEEVIQQKLHEYASQQERMRQYEVELRAQMLARSEVARTQSAYDEQIKRCSDLEGQLQAVRSQLQEKEEQIQQLQQQVQQLRETQMQTNEAAWAKEGLLREQSNELLTLRAERDSAIAEGNAKAALCEEERAEHLKQVEELKEQINEKDRQLEAAKEQAREQQEMLWNKEEQLRETAAWALRAQELEMLHMSLATDLREKHEQLNQLWAVHQRQSQQLTESERYHQMVIAGLQAEVREQSRVLGVGKTLPATATLPGNDQKHERNGSVGQTIGDSLVSGESHPGAESGSQIRGLRSVGAAAAVVSARTKLAVSAPGVIDAVIPVVIPRDAPSKVEQATGVPVVTPPILSLAPGMPPPGPLSAQLHLHMHQPTAVPSPHHMHQAAIQVGPHQQQVASLQQIPVLTSQQHYATQNSIQPQAIVQHQSQLQQQQALQAQRGQHRQLMQRPVQVQQQQQQQQQPRQQEEATTHTGQVAQQAQSQGMSQTSLGQHHHVQHHQSSSQQHSQSHQTVHHHQQLQATHQQQLQSHQQQQQQLVQQQDQQQQEQHQVLRQQDKQQEQQHLQPQTQHRSEQEEKQLQFQEHLQDQAHHLEGGQVGLMQQPHVSTESHMVGQQQQQGGGQGGHGQHPQILTMLNKGQTYPSQHMVEMHPHGPAVGSHFPGQQPSHLTYHHQQQPQSRFLQASRQIMPHGLQQGTQQIGHTQPQQQSQQQQQPDQQTQQQQFPVSSAMQAQSQQHEQHGQNVQTMSDQVHGSVLVQQQQAVSLVAKQQNVQEACAQPQAHTAPVQSETMPGQSHMSQGDQSVHLQHQQGLQATEQMGMVSSSVGLMGPGAVPSAIQTQQNQFVQGQQGLSAASRTSECHQEREVTVSGEGPSGKTSSIELAGNRPAAHTQLLDEKALLQCLFRIIPSSDPKDALKISTTVANRLTKFLAPLHWHDYRKQYGRLDEFLASHSECFVLLDNDHVCLQEGARSVISGLAVSARAAAVAAAGVQTAMSSISPTVVVTPVSAQAAMRSRGLRPGMAMVPVSREKIMNLGSQPSAGGVSNTGSGGGNNNPHGSVVGVTSDGTTKSVCVPVSGAESTGMGDGQVLNARSGNMSNGFGGMRNSASNGPPGMNSAVNGGHPLGGGAGSSGINVRGAQPPTGSKVNGMLSANGIIGPPAGVGNGVMNGGHVMSGGNQRGGAYGYAAVRANTR